MAEFLTAEQIAAAKSGSITDSELQTALEQRRYNYNTPVHSQRKGILCILCMDTMYNR